MSATTPSVFERPAVRIAAFVCTLGVVLGGGAIIGAAVGPEPNDAPARGHDKADEPVPAEGLALPEGLAISRDGYSLDLAGTRFQAGADIELAFEITGPDGDTVTDFDVAHDEELHLIVVGRDLVDYLHVHPERGPDGTWSIVLPPRAAGSYRVFADFTPTGAGSLTLGADIAVAGDFAPRALPAASRSVVADGYTVELDGTLVAGTASTVTLSVSDDDGPIDDLDPYLGALGHLVAIRGGDLAYLHVHPAPQAEREGSADEPGGPDIEFTVEVPTAGTYRLFLDFSHGGDVHTAAFTVEALPAEHQTGDTTGDSTEGTAHGDH